MLLDGAEIASLPTREVAKRLGFLPQSPVPPEGLTVEDLVQRGRFPHQRLGRRSSAEDRERVDWALSATGIAELRDRPLDRLSGGQRQRAWIAMALAQDTPILLLDEPTTYLDLAHQLEVLDLLVDLNAAGRTIGIVLHDLNHACRYAHHLVALRDGVVHAGRAAGGDRRRGARARGLRAALARDPRSRSPGRRCACRSAGPSRVRPPR